MSEHVPPYCVETLPMPPMRNQNETARFVEEELSEWFYTIAKCVEAEVELPVGLLLDLEGITRAVGHYLRTGEQPEILDHSAQGVAELASLMRKQADRIENTDAHTLKLLARSLERASAAS